MKPLKFLKFFAVLLLNICISSMFYVLLTSSASLWLQYYHPGKVLVEVLLAYNFVATIMTSQHTIGAVNALVVMTILTFFV